MPLSMDPLVSDQTAMHRTLVLLDQCPQVPMVVAHRWHLPHKWRVDQGLILQASQVLDEAQLLQAQAP